MLIAIDETGSFGAKSGGEHLFIAVMFRETGGRLDQKFAQLKQWESSLPRSLKNSKGEFKGAALKDQQLLDFAKQVYASLPVIGITPVTLSPAEHAPEIIAKYRHTMGVGIQEGIKGYSSLGRPAMARMWEEMGNWFKRLTDGQFLKIFLLGECISLAFNNAIGHSVSGDFDLELPDLRFKIDRDFIREKRHLTFWRELLRNQLWASSERHPTPLVDEWATTGHPFLTKFQRNGRLDFNELFTKNCGFFSSHECPALRVADYTASIFNRALNHGTCREAIHIVRQRIQHDGSISKIVLPDFDLTQWRYDPKANPWGQPA